MFSYRSLLSLHSCSLQFNIQSLSIYLPLRWTCQCKCQISLGFLPSLAGFRHLSVEPSPFSGNLGCPVQWNIPFSQCDNAPSSEKERLPLSPLFWLIEWPCTHLFLLIALGLDFTKHHMSFLSFMANPAISARTALRCVWKLFHGKTADRNGNQLPRPDYPQSCIAVNT